jgi:RNA polymerase sigma-70 factor (ECF subfamily)
MDLCTHCVWEQFSQQLRNFILKRVGDAQDAEDILQDVFLKIHQHLHTLRDDERLLPWLYQITRNTIIDYYRTRRPSAELPEEEASFAAPEEPTASDAIAMSLKDFIAELPDKYRQALLLTEFENVSQKDLAQRLSISVSGAKSRVQRGRILLKQSLEDCCQFEFDRYGHPIDYTPRQACCCDHRGG